MNNILIDTSVLIDHLRKYAPATNFLENIFKSGIPVKLSTVTVMELFAGKSMQNPKREEAVVQLLELFESVPVTQKIAKRAGILLRFYRSNGLTPADALIAGTALEQEAALVTRNIRHFRQIEGLLVFDLPED